LVTVSKAKRNLMKVKEPREDEQVVIRKMRALRDGGAGYRQIADWMASSHPEGALTFMGVKLLLLEAN
jgi:hypothetical protein